MSPERIPPIKPSDLTAEQKDAYDYMSQKADEFFGDAFTYKKDDGSLIGPFAPFLYTPALGKPFFDFVGAVSQIPGLPGTAREVVILATGAHYKGVYETYAHERVALKTTDLTKEQIKMIKSGEKPKDLGKGESVAFDATMELVGKPGPLAKERWDEVVKEFGEQGALALVHYVGLYAYTCILLNGCDVSLPEDEKLLEERAQSLI
ncbi:uncharacterized protein PAC_08763 [Phialocephala subalpina]|uniref:Carboxymuconolactone decarboxylase-like domain-containing protein n=1 Tax=Phialocephala subalpina TaxID=576137 RepID=A0A1L7X1G7_9HELO|nr:uncharacterized protein PAC_08763 [Phialocephala subalpina]